MPVLEELKSKIEQLNKQHHIEILKILKRNNTVTLNENKSGVYVNLSLLPDQSIADIYNYVQYIEEQEATLSSLETQKLDFKNTFFNEKEDKE
jgi:predicted ATP-binding protein involved in virulence